MNEFHLILAFDVLRQTTFFFFCLRLIDGVPFPSSHIVVTPVSQRVSVPHQRQQDQALTESALLA